MDARLARQYEGAGLGLVLVKQIAELLGENVSVESVFGQGSRFTVTLPMLAGPSCMNFSLEPDLASQLFPLAFGLILIYELHWSV